VEGAVLQAFSHGVQVVGVFSSSSGDVKDVDWGLHVLGSVGHVRDPARENAGTTHALKVPTQAGLASVASSVSDPDDVAVITIASNLVQEVLLPVTWHEARVIRDLLQLSQAELTQL